jgi:hypothetical protein
LAEMTRIDIAKDFSPAPSGRFPSDGPNSGERFREQFLLPAIRAGGQIELVIDGTAGYHSSFLEEAFGGAIRRRYISGSELKARLHIIYQDREFEMFKDMIELFINDASPS